jgi:hypothetical protein
MKTFVRRTKEATGKYYVDLLQKIVPVCPAASRLHGRQSERNKKSLRGVNRTSPKPPSMLRPPALGKSEN